MMQRYWLAALLCACDSGVSVYTSNETVNMALSTVETVSESSGTGSAPEAEPDPVVEGPQKSQWVFLEESEIMAATAEFRPAERASSEKLVSVPLREQTTGVLTCNAPVDDYREFEAANARGPSEDDSVVKEVSIIERILALPAGDILAESALEVDQVP